MLIFSHGAVECCSASIDPLFEHSILVCLSLFNGPPPGKAQSDVIGQLFQAWVGTAHRVSASALLVFCHDISAEGCCLYHYDSRSLWKSWRLIRDGLRVPAG